MPVMDEYLVRLGAAVDSSGMNKFHQALREASSVADNSAKSITSSFFKAQAEIVGGFATIGAAALGFAEKVAMADQNYRLFAMHMFLGKEQARGLKVAMDALGASLEDMTWDPELRARTQQLLADQKAMAPNGDFDEQMRKIRDIRFEFTRMQVEVEYLGMHVVQDFMKALGFGPDELLNKLHKFNDWVTTNLPAVSQKMVTLFMPIWNDIKMVGTATAEAFEAASVAFTNVIGVLSGDDAIMGTTFSIEKLVGAVDHIVHGFANFATAIADVEIMLAHLISAIALLFHFRFEDAATELGAAFSSVTGKGLGAVGGATAGAIGLGTAGATVGGAIGSIFGPVGTALGAWAGGAVGGSIGAGTGGFIGSNVGANFDSSSVGGPGGGPGGSLVTKYANQYGVPLALAHALAMAESSENQAARSPTGPVGVMQLAGDTARGLGVDRYNADQNVEGGMRLFGGLLKKYNGNEAMAIAEYHEGLPKMNRIMSRQATLSDAAKREIQRVMSGEGHYGDFQIGSIVVNVTKPGATNADVGRAVAANLRDMQTKQSQRNQYEEPHWLGG